MTPLDKLASTALSSKFQAFTVAMTAVMTINDIPGPWRAGAIVLIAAAYMFSRAWEDRGRIVPAAQAVQIVPAQPRTAQPPIENA